MEKKGIWKRPKDEKYINTKGGATYAEKFVFISLSILVIITAIFYCFHSDSDTPFSTLQVKPPEYLPIICQPEEDQKKILVVYYHKYPNTNITEFTLVFAGEEHPNRFVNKIYTIIRILRYHRVEDMESFYITINEKGKLQGVNFSYMDVGTYSDKQTYNTFYPKHCIRQIPYSEFEFSNNRPHIYVNTWNHLLGEKNNNPELSYAVWEDYPLLVGTRKKAESDFKQAQ